MKVSSVPSRWILDQGSRLDASPYLSGAMDARMTLAKLSVPCDRLGDVTENIFHAGRESRSWVTDPNHGIPFVSSSGILKADLTDVPLLSKKQVARNPGFLIRKGWTLITRSGTIGRMVYVRPDMDGMACSEHAMRVVPNEARVPPGYLHAFLRSRFGIPMVVGGTYGSIIQSIEPEHVADLPVPRLGAQVEGQAHSLVEKAAALRSRASSQIADAVIKLDRVAGLTPLQPAESPTPFGTRAVPARSIGARFDAFFHSEYHESARRSILTSPIGYMRLAQIAASIIEPGRFKRVQVKDEEFGVPFFGTSAIFWVEPICNYYIPKRQEDIEQYIVSRRTVLIPRSGQLSGIIGHAVLPYGDVIGAAVSEDAIRINCEDEDTAGFVHVALTSEYGRRQLKARAYGSSIPHLDVTQVGEVVIPDPGKRKRAEIGRIGAEVATMRDQAVKLERQARTIVETAIEEAA